ncbi:MAG: permease [Firmicutes bacterium]|nr:permease [Bacillota bacterium]
MKKYYRNFSAAVYFTIGDVERYADPGLLAEKVEFLQKHIRCNKVYLETFRGGHIIAKETILRVKEFFAGRGFETAGGITPFAGEGWRFQSFCYTNQEHLAKLKKVVEFTAGIFDEIILDDFFFTNCKCESCIKAKGEKTWSQFRIGLMEEISREVVIKTAKKVNPRVKMVIKYPNWYEYYQNTGYNLEAQPEIFDLIYTGTETRNPLYTQQSLPRYTGYFLMRYLENVKPGKNGGGWFDTFDCLYNLGSYVEQAYLTLFAKAREVTLFCAGLLFSRGSIFLPLAGHVFEQVDGFLGKTGAPLGVSCYKPYHSSCAQGENYLHGYLGMLGIPLEPAPEFLVDSGLVLLTASAAGDSGIVAKIKEHLRRGKKVVITSGFLRALHTPAHTRDKGFEEIAEIWDTGNKVMVQEFAYPVHECSFGNYYQAAKAILIPEIEFATNDTRQLIVGFGAQNNFPILLEADYGRGLLYVLTVPENPGDLYALPAEVLNEIRRVLTADLDVRLEGPANVGLFVYDNNTLIVESFLPYFSDIRIVVEQKNANLVDLVSGEKISGQTVGDKSILPLKWNPQPTGFFSATK